MELLVESLTKLLAAAVLGGLVGLERELSHKPAGLRTNMLICIGAALLMILSLLVANEGGRSGDPGRIAAQVVTGIGFLGAGAIVHSRGAVVGLTTGATIFTVAAIGLAIGGGYYLPALLATAIVILSLFVLGRIEKRMLASTRSVYEYHLETSDAPTALARLTEILRAHGVEMEGASFEKTNAGMAIRFVLSVPPEVNERLLPELLSVPGRLRMEIPREL
ncbi:MAG: MgtC/SapB family protein [Blastocatellia bacterium]|nr:MgtC/SapB family protein [Blastocatellia bacterium]MCX7752282.1 MgtC/SapB family protein [Blastocatellia bacterium]MDW8167774.1 MgtC/SapB family protein [Acidobacteriota bacterium]MDW8256595.1 MgtC/SapB family protein [Acidobacteriota bacterium]